MRVMRADPRCGRPLVATPAMMKALEDYAEEMRWDFTWEEAAEYLGDISPETLRRHAKISGWRTVYGRILPLLSPRHQERRLEWAHDHRRSTWNDWVDLD